MGFEKLDRDLAEQLAGLNQTGTAKGDETVVVKVLPATAGRGPRFLLRGEGEREFIRMNSNSYLGLGFSPELLRAEEEAAHRFGVGPGAVRFISGTCAPHVELEAALARFHGREDALATSSAYATVVGTLAALTTPETVLVSDELNHNCIVNGAKLARPKERKIYKHLDYDGLDRALSESAGAQGVLVITDGVFSMRGDLAHLDKVKAICDRHDAKFPRNAVLMVDDSHGVGAFGRTGRGTEEVTHGRADILIGTLGKAFGVNGGYVTGSRTLIRYLREKTPTYIYSNPISAGEAAAALKAVQLVDTQAGKERLAHLGEMTERFRSGIVGLGYETIAGQHPVVPLLVRDTDRTRKLVAFLRSRSILATGLNYPVVPKGEQLIRFQVSAEHQAADIDAVLAALKDFKAAA